MLEIGKTITAISQYNRSLQRATVCINWVDRFYTHH